MRSTVPLFATLLLTSCATGTTPQPDTAALAAQASLQGREAPPPAEAMQRCPRELPRLESGVPEEVKSNHRRTAKQYHDCAGRFDKLIEFEETRARQ
jgi:hypothetical protein